jgi:hypothetical protein
MFAMLAVLAAATFVVPATANAAETTLCREDPGELEEEGCPEGKAASHVHFTSTEKGKLLNSLVKVECDVLFLGDKVESSEAPLLLKGQFTYTNCGTCTATQVSESVLLSVIRTSHETADVTGEGEVHVKCGSFIDCYYEGDELLGTGKGPLLSIAERGEVSLSEQEVHKVKGTFCPSVAKLDLRVTPLEALYIRGEERTGGGGGEKKEPPKTFKTALCTTDDATTTCLEEHKPSSLDFKDSAVEFLTSLLNSKCEGLFSGTVGAAANPQEVSGESKFSGCTNSCVITEISGGSTLAFGREEASESAYVTAQNLELFVKCGTAVKCAFGPIELTGVAKGALPTGDNGHITVTKSSLGPGEGILCPTEASLDALFVASSPVYIREDYAKPPTSLCSKDEKSPICKSENQLKSIDYKDKAVELLTNLINVKCEGLVSGTVGAPGNPLEMKPELTYSNCGGGCFVTVVSGPGKILLQREGKAEEAKATAEGFEIFVKCGTTIKCLLGPEKMVGTALGALTTGDNGRLTFSKASLGKGEGAVCPKEATLDAVYVASSAAYIG